MKRFICIFLFVSLVLLTACASRESKKIMNDFKVAVEGELNAFGHLEKYEVTGLHVDVYLEKEYDDLKENAQINFLNKVCDRIYKAATDSGVFQKWPDTTVYVKVCTFDGKRLDTYLVEKDSK